MYVVLILMAVLIFFGMLMMLEISRNKQRAKDAIENAEKERLKKERDEADRLKKERRRSLKLSDSHDKCPICGSRSMAYSTSNMNLRPESLIEYWFCIQCDEDTCVVRTP